MGQPLQLGPYAGLRPFGLAVGPSRFKADPDSPSTLEAPAVEASIDPLASLLQRAVVLQIRVLSPTVELRRNSRGAFWQLGPQPPGGPPPRLALRLQVPRPGQGVLHSSNGRQLRFAVSGSADLELWNRAVAVRGRVAPRDGGQLPFQLQANWQQRSWQLQLQPRQLQLKPVLPLLPPGLHAQLVGRLEGALNGSLSLARQPGRNRCDGGLTATQLRWQPPGAGTAPLLAPRLALLCTAQGVRLQPSTLNWGSWRGALEGDLRLQAGGAARQPGALQLLLKAAQPAAGQQLQARLAGPWQNPDLSLSATLPGPSLPRLPAQPLKLQAQVAMRSQPQLRLQLRDLQLRRGTSLFRASGELWPLVSVRSRGLELGPDLRASLRPWLGSAPQLKASLQQLSGWGSPRFQLDLSQPANPLLGDWLAQLRWQPGLLELARFSAPQLQASGRLPLLAQPKGGLRPGALDLQLDLQRYPLERLTPLLGTRMRGAFSAWGVLRGPLGQLQPDLQLLVEQPGAGPLLLAESWRGSLRGQAAGGGDLQLQALAPALPGALQARLDQRWLPSQARLRRSGGELAFSGDPRRYSWQARAFPLAGLQLALGPSARFQPLLGDLSGRGQLDLQPLWISGSVALQRPLFLGVYGRSLVASGQYRDRRYSARGEWQGEQQETVQIQLKGVQGGALWARFEARQFGSTALQQLLLASQRLRSGPLLFSGSAADLLGLSIDTLGLSLSDQLAALDKAREAIAQRFQRDNRAGREFDPADLQGLLNADITLTGPQLDRLSLDLEADGHLWLRGDDRDRALSAQPLQVSLRGPLNGAGTFSIEHLPLALLALFAPVPEGLRGGLAATGRFVLPGSGRRRPELQVELALQDAALGDQGLQLERGELALKNDSLSLDWSLRSSGAANGIDLRGTIPLQPDRPDLELRVASRGDGLRFLSQLGGAGVQWQQGSADLQLLVRGSLEEPIANGFLRFRDGVLLVAGQTMRQLEATVLFDFRELELQQLSARVGEKGEISGSGQLGLVQSIAGQPRPLKLQVKQVPFKVPRLQAQADGEVQVSGSLRQPQLGGEIQISRGSINVQPGGLATESNPTQPVSVTQLAEERWTFQEPLVVMGQQMEGDTSRDLRASVPNVPFLRFNGLRVRLGPDLRVSVPNLLNFNTGGLLTLRGGLDPSLEVIGVVRLLKGRLSLFTTTFNLDPDAANVAVFTPSLGLIPYVDVALRTRVSDTLMAANSSSEVNLNNWNVAAADSIDQLQLVKVRVEASGPADRLSQNIRISSNPPLSQERLLALIGGNSLVGLASGNAGAALATVLGQSLLSPVVSGLSDAFGQRLTFAIYPTYFIPQVETASERNSRQLPSELVLGTEIGLDITERFNFSVLAAPNRSDLPPQLTLNYQASQQVGVQTSVDTQGRWQSQLQLLLRF